MAHRIKNVALPLLVLLLINVAFFLPLFFPKLKLLVTPEFGGGDENIFHYPVKFLFQKMLRQGELLIWSKDMGGGYPVFAMGETGFYSPVNLLTLFFLPFAWAVNTQMFISILMLLFFTYGLGRTLKLGKISSVYFATVFGYSFFIISNLIHLSHLASFVYIPAVFALLLKILDESRIRLINFLLLSFCLFLQFISGHPQYFFYSTLLIYFYLLLHFFYSAKSKRKTILIKGLAISSSLLVSLALSAFQLLPIVEYYAFSNRGVGGNFAITGGLNIKDLLNMFYPFIFYGIDLKMKAGTSSLLPPWDGNLYFGFLPFFLILIGLSAYKKTKILDFIKNKYFLVFGCILLLLALGSNSPLYFINASPPFSLFRVPARIVFLIILMASATSAYVFDKLFQKKKFFVKITLIMLMMVNTILNMIIMYRFHIFQSPEKYLQKNNVINYLQKNQAGRLLSIYFYNEILPRELYQNGINKTNNLNLEIVSRALPQNVNQYFGLKSINLPSSGFNLNRHFLFDDSLFDEKETYGRREETKTASLSAAASGLLRLSNTDFILSPYKIFDPHGSIYMVKKYGLSSSFNVYLYKNLNFGSRLIFSDNPERVFTVKQLKENLAKTPKSSSVDVEADYPGNKFSSKNRSNFSYRILSDRNNFFKAEVKSQNNGVLVLADNYYPGWKAFVDNKPAKIFRANFLYRGIILPYGKHVVEFKYQPDSIKFGIMISGVTLLILALAVIACLRRHPQFSLNR